MKPMKPTEKTVAPCIIVEGTLIDKRDMLRALDTLEDVRFAYTVDGTEVAHGEGVVVKVFSCPEASTLVINGCLFLNVMSFDYLRFYPYKKGLAKIELVEEARVLKLVPIAESAKQLAKANRELYSNEAYEGPPPALCDELWDDEED